MQKRKSFWVSAALFLTLAVCFAALPLFAAGTPAPGTVTGGNTAGQNSAGDSARGGLLNEAADAVRGAAEGIFGGRRDADNAAGNAADGNTADGNLSGKGVAGNTNGNNTADRPMTDNGDELLPGETAGDGATLGDVNGDGITDDRAPETTTGSQQNEDTGFSWGGVLLAFLAAAAAVAVVVLLIPKKEKR